MSPKLADVLERGLWTVAQAAVSFGITETANVSYWWAIPAAGLLSAAKTFLLNNEPAEPAAPSDGGK